MQTINRRQMLAGTTAAWLVAGHTTAAAPKTVVRETKVISHRPDLYHGWPTLARRRNGQLLLVCSGGRESHVCPFGRVEMMRSDDDGQTWGWPRVMIDSAIDDRDAGVLETAKGSILVTTFTSSAYEPILAQAEKSGAWSEQRLRHWQAAHRRLSAEQRQSELGVWMVRSTDGGVTFSARYDCLVDSPHGPIQLADGRLLYGGKDLWRPKHRVGFCESTDDGQTWRWLAELPVREGDSHENYHELHAVAAADGRLVAQIRNHNGANSRETLQSESADGGKTWSAPRSIGVWGLPSHLLRLKDDRLLMTYGHRRAPLGNQARVSKDHGRTWSEAMIVSGDGTSGDLGYPSTVELADGSLVSVWYEQMKGSARAVLRQARWTIGG
ncbi:MAG: exo-alpha-sialidase [Candidatus Nealsonbacteria bacterium]|nr:exo-alpha-sialidase [Candidatus Nealsonbacteria bacterium]